MLLSAPMRIARFLAALALAGVPPLLALPLVGDVASTRAADDYVDVDAGDDFFEAPIIRVAIGAEVEWTNVGRSPHTVTADDATFDSGNMVPGDTFAQTFDAPGVYRYFCLYHGAPGGVGMAGAVLVGDAELPAPGGGVGPGREPVPAGPGDTIRVPQDEATIQGAVDAAAPGDLVLIDPGIYPERVLVTTPYLTIRGTDRNRVILDGEYRLPNGIQVVEADGVAVENLTLRHYTANGAYWTGVQGYRASWLNAVANGDYGIYAFNSAWGRFEHSYAAGNPDSGFYIGECYPCHAVIDDVLAEDNAVGYSGTNAGGDLWIINSEWRDNMSGIVPNTLDSELLPPQREAVIAGNWVHHNNNVGAPAKPLTTLGLGIGIVVTGGLDNRVTGNRVEAHDWYGIAVLPMIDDNLWLSGGNRVTGNAVHASGVADLALGAFSQGGDCASGNEFSTSLPVLLEQQYACGPDLVASSAPRPGGGSMSVSNVLLVRFAGYLNQHVPGGDWTAYPDGPDQPGMPDPMAVRELAIPETALPGPVEIRPLDQVPSISPNDPIPTEVTFMGIPLAASPAALLIGLYGYAFPLILYTAWVVLALWDLARREDLSGGARAWWSLAVLVVPLVGPLGYLLAGGSTIPRGMRLMLIVGGLAVYIALAAVGVLLA